MATHRGALMWIDKAGTWVPAEVLGGAARVQIVTNDTHTCDLGNRSVRHARSYGCGAFPPAADAERQKFLEIS